MKFNLFIGRYQSPHKGHMHIFETYLKKGMQVLIAIRDVETNADNPLTGFQIKAIWEKIYANNPLVQVIIIPDISSVNYGRQVGYEVNEINVDANIPVKRNKQKCLGKIYKVFISIGVFYCWSIQK